MNTKKGLGKGFGSLLPEDFDSSVMLDKDERIHKILIQDIKPDSNQPRRNFDKIAINELAESIKRYGILQPLVVRDQAGKYIIIAGERRYHAAKVASLTHLPVLVRTLEELERLEVGLIENMQRVDLSPMEQALSIAKLNEQFSVPLQDVAKRLGKAHTTIINTVRLLQLPDFARRALEETKITEGHARAILALSGKPKEQRIMLDLILKNSWSVRQAEAYTQTVKLLAKPSSSAPKTIDKKDQENERNLVKKFNAKVKISVGSSGKSVKFTFKSNKEFVQFIDNLK